MASTAVFICQGGQGGSPSLEHKRLRWCAEAQGVPVWEVSQACAQDGAATLARLALRQGVESFILAACPLAGRGGPLAQQLAAAGLDPQALLHLDVCQGPPQEGRPCPVREGAVQALAQALISQEALAQAAAQVREVSRRVMVLGDGLLALGLTRELLWAGYPVLLLTPGRRLAPPEPLLGPEAARQAAALAWELEETSGLEVVPGGRLLALAGQAGDFSVSLLDRQGQRLKRRVGAVAVSQGPPLALNLGASGLEPGPRVISLAELAGWLDSPEHFRRALPGRERPAVGLMLGLGRQASPLGLRAACRLGLALMEEHGAQVTLYTRQAKVAAPDLEALSQAARARGMLMVKFSQGVPRASQRDDGLEVAYHEEILDLEVIQRLDLLAVDQTPAPDQAWRGLARVLGLGVGRDGSLQPDLVGALPTASGRAGVFLLGPAARAWDLTAGQDQASQVLLAVRELLARGKVSAPAGRVRVDRRLCALCLTCVRVCPVGAMGQDERRPQANPLACTACGTCAAECPMDAIQIIGCDDATSLRQVGAALAKSPSGLWTEQETELLVFACANSAGRALEAARLEGQPWPKGARLVQVPCAGRLDVAHVLKAFQEGLDGVLVLGCHTDACYNLGGGNWAGYRLEHLADLLIQAGCDPRRLKRAGVAAAMPGQVMEIIAQARQSLEELGPNPLKTGARVREFLGRFTVQMDETYAIAG